MLFNKNDSRPEEFDPYVLVVEDDAAIQRCLKDALEFGGFRVQTAPNGLEALKFLQRPEQPPALIFLDLMMPVMDGWEFIEKLEYLPETCQVPVVVLSAVATKKTITSDSVKRVILKPIEMDHLIDTAKEFCPN